MRHSEDVPYEDWYEQVIEYAHVKGIPSTEIPDEDNLFSLYEQDYDAYDIFNNNHGSSTDWYELLNRVVG